MVKFQVFVEGIYNLILFCFFDIWIGVDCKVNIKFKVLKRSRVGICVGVVGEESLLIEEGFDEEDEDVNVNGDYDEDYESEYSEDDEEEEGEVLKVKLKGKNLGKDIDFLEKIDGGGLFDGFVEQICYFWYNLVIVNFVLGVN